MIAITTIFLTHQPEIELNVSREMCGCGETHILIESADMRTSILGSPDNLKKFAHTLMLIAQREEIAESNTVREG